MNVKTNKYVKEAMEVNEIILIDILHFVKFVSKNLFATLKCLHRQHRPINQQIAERQSRAVKPKYIATIPPRARSE
jgi:hypothetical protein